MNLLWKAKTPFLSLRKDNFLAKGRIAIRNQMHPLWKEGVIIGHNFDQVLFSFCF